MFSISVCMITKNEELTLSRVLSCAKKFADEIIIVDTGSIDKTKEIAKKFTDKVFDFEWCDDFSKARNFSFSQAKCDYLMWLDADDFISDQNIAKIIALKSSSLAPDMFFFKYEMGFDSVGKATFVFERERLLKRSSNFVWKGFVHEAIEPRGTIFHADISIEHRKEKVSDPKRNLKIYRKAKGKGVVFSAREQYYYARELFYNGYYVSAIKGMEKFLKMNEKYAPDEYGAMIIISDCFLFLSKISQAKKMLFCAFERFPTSEVCCKIAYIYEFEQKFVHARLFYQCALNCKRDFGGFIRKDYESDIPTKALERLKEF